MSDYLNELADAFEKGFLAVGTIAVITEALASLLLIGLIVWAADVWTKWRNR